MKRFFITLLSIFILMLTGCCMPTEAVYEPDPVIVALDNDGNVIAEIDEINEMFSSGPSKERQVYRKIRVDGVDYKLSLQKNGFSITNCTDGICFSEDDNIVSFTDFFKGASINLSKTDYYDDVRKDCFMMFKKEPYLGPVYFTDIYKKVE